MESNEAMKAMLERIREEHWPNFDAAVMAAIMETQEACAKLAEAVAADCLKFPNVSERRASALWADTIAERIRAGEHYAAIGEDIGGGRG